MPKPDLADVIARWREDAANLKRLAVAPELARSLERCAKDAEEAAEEWLGWINEGLATLRSGKSVAWLRAQFPAWERDGHAKLVHRGLRHYRECVIPRRASDLPSIAAVTAVRRARGLPE